MTEYTRCPGICAPRRKVKIWGEREISYCCHPCWEQTWADAQGKPVPGGPKHSGRCVDRQENRWNVRIVHPGSREWIVSGPRVNSRGDRTVQPTDLVDAPRPFDHTVPATFQDVALESSCTIPDNVSFPVQNFTWSDGSAAWVISEGVAADLSTALHTEAQLLRDQYHEWLNSDDNTVPEMP